MNGVEYKMKEKCELLAVVESELCGGDGGGAKKMKLARSSRIAVEMRDWVSRRWRTRGSWWWRREDNDENEGSDGVVVVCGGVIWFRDGEEGREKRGVAAAMDVALCGVMEKKGCAMGVVVAATADVDSGCCAIATVRDTGGTTLEARLMLGGEFVCSYVNSVGAGRRCVWIVGPVGVGRRVCLLSRQFNWCWKTGLCVWLVGLVGAGRRVFLSR
ncbi:hypothetical protein LR48_Vigan01g151900 [Vigna angularis]|uniref:Uncharacterized protein n=1 Tax=Phaseolus angularis TaxID=3914 RepID=A0A0L9TN25_PHAAN|nr:hypothetical protein LR48_Vigan01g151900 [Vigna angularis]